MKAQMILKPHVLRNGKPGRPRTVYLIESATGYSEERIERLNKETLEEC